MPGPGLHPLRFRSLGVLPLLALAGLCTHADARAPKLSRYPLRIHVLASDETHKTPRMSAGDAVVCDAIEGNTASSVTLTSGTPFLIGGFGGDPCSLHPDRMTGLLFDNPDAAPIFSGSGRADLVTPPAGTQGFSFRYDDCTRVRVLTGFQSLPARWKKPGQKLEVLIPSDDVPRNGRTLPPIKCTLTATLHDFVYLLLPSGKLIEISQEAYWQRPALRVFLSGRTQAVQTRPKQYTVSAHPASATTTH